MAKSPAGPPPPHNNDNPKTTTNWPKSATKNSRHWPEIEAFAKNAQIPHFRSSRVHKLEKHIDCNDNLSLGAFQNIKHIWAGLKKKGVSPSIWNPQNCVDHILKATGPIPHYHGYAVTYRN